LVEGILPLRRQRGECIRSEQVREKQCFYTPATVRMASALKPARKLDFQ
jgi:hypothetical protein